MNVQVETEMLTTSINGKYELLLPKHRAERQEWAAANGGWEAARIERMMEVIDELDVVFDLGTEEGDISALLQKYRGCEMVLVEPNPLVWPCVKAIWQANKLSDPLDFYKGFFSNVTTDQVLKYGGFDDVNISDMIHNHGFAALSDQRPDIPQIKMDDYCRAKRIIPNVITMDCEGAEFEVVKGAEKTLREHRPHIFMSIHPEFMYGTYQHDDQWAERIGEKKQYVVQLLRFVDECGYKHRVIEYDYHELHMEFIPK